MVLDLTKKFECPRCGRETCREKGPCKYCLIKELFDKEELKEKK